MAYRGADRRESARSSAGSFFDFLTALARRSYARYPWVDSCPSVTPVVLSCKGKDKFNGKIGTVTVETFPGKK